jgi:hypothetical protein
LEIFPLPKPIGRLRKNDTVDYISVATQTVQTPEGLRKGTRIPFYAEYADEQPNLHVDENLVESTIYDY